MSTYTYDMHHALVDERISRYQAEAATHRMARSGDPQRAGAFHRLTHSIGQGLSTVAATFKVDRRAQLPSI
ncbi:MAG: hypothetical protein ACRDZM_08115 [Acidimicrobiia bacterium]